MCIEISSSANCPARYPNDTFRISTSPRARATHSTAAPVAALSPLKTCGDQGCRTYEAASFALPLAALALERGAALDITIVTQAGDGPSIRFPAAILANLHRALGTQQTTSLAKP